MVKPARYLMPVAVLALLSSLGCSQGGAALDAPEPATARGVAIASVITHDAKVAIFGGGAGLRVVVRKLDGTLVADGVTLDALRVQDPALYELVTSAYASSDGHAYVDATLGPTN